MSIYEYKVVPAPKKGLRAKGVKGQDGRFAHALEGAINALAAEGWEYQRTDTLPSEERAGLTGKTTVFQNMLIFRRARSEAAETTEAAPAAVSAEEEMPEAAAPDTVEDAETPEANAHEATEPPEDETDRELAAQ